MNWSDFEVETLSTEQLEYVEQRIKLEVEPNIKDKGANYTGFEAPNRYRTGFKGEIGFGQVLRREIGNGFTWVRGIGHTDFIVNTDHIDVKTSSTFYQRRPGMLVNCEQHRAHRDSNIYVAAALLKPWKVIIHGWCFYEEASQAPRKWFPQWETESYDITELHPMRELWPRLRYEQAV
jgi:hypothetical protein